MADSYQGVGGRDRAWVLTQSLLFCLICAFIFCSLTFFYLLF